MNEQFILKIVKSVEPELFWLFLKFMIIGIILLVIKGYIENIVAYIAFRLDKRLGLEVKVRVNGIEGKIVDYNFSWIFIKTESGMELVVMKRWRLSKWAIINGE
jgi:hypothetical protein